MSNTVFVLCGRYRKLIGVFDSVELCMSWCNKQGEKEYTYFVEYFSRPYAQLGPGPGQDYTISEEEVLSGHVDDYPKFEVTFS